MAIALLETDTWLSHLVFTGGRRETEFGPLDGMFYGVLSVAGDATGGNVTINGRLSFDRKEDWVYVIEGSVMGTNTETATSDWFEQVNTGPLLPTATAVANPTFTVGGPSNPMGASGLTTPASNILKPYYGMPIFGDKRIQGVFLMYAAGFQTNVNLALYTASIWGKLYRYNSFFRNRDPKDG